MNNNFNMETFIEKRLLEIENLDDRKETREVLTQIFKELYKYTEERFQNMEQNIADEIKKQEEEYTIYTGISSKSTFDITEGNMFPIVESDLEENVISIKELRDSLKGGNELKAFTVFFELDYKEIRKLVSERRCFGGYICTENGEYPVTACIRIADRYQKVIRELFKIVIQNGISWKTMCMAYINKFFDVYLMTADVPEDEYISKIEIDFQEYAQAVRYHYFPTWNIEKIYAISEVKKVASIDVVQYQHYLSKKYIKDEFCLIADTKNMLSRINKDEGILITTDVADVQKWEVLVLKNKAKQLSEYPILGNQTEGRKGNPSRTKGDIFKVVKAMGYEERLELRDIIFPQEYKAFGVVYDMNYGIAQEYRHNSDLQPMVLQFEKKKEDFLQTDILSYLISGVQRYYPEYICYGEYVKAE